MTFITQGQFSEEQILDNNENSPMFEEFLQLLGDKVRLRGFDKYKGGLGKFTFTLTFTANSMLLMMEIHSLVKFLC
jgi:hypothetical protein